MIYFMFSSTLLIQFFLISGLFNGCFLLINFSSHFRFPLFIFFLLVSMIVMLLGELVSEFHNRWMIGSV